MRYNSVRAWYGFKSLTDLDLFIYGMERHKYDTNVYSYCTLILLHIIV